ncbi:MAG: ATP-binding protein [Zoogloea sp.]|uniref:sensor histidine kinase n=1 Tax=Zoogloea sp. TaxID=49181 RepID=UPI003F2A73E8
MNPLMSTFFDQLGDGITLVNPEGMVTYTNAAGLRMFKAIPGQPFPDPRVVRAVKDVVSGLISPPAKVPLGEGVLDQAKVAAITPLPIPNTIAISIQDQESRAFYDMTLNNFHEFVNIELAQPIQRFARAADNYRNALADASRADPQLVQLIEDGNMIGSRLGRIRFMAELFRSAPLVAQDRLEFADMIGDALDAESASLTSREITVYLQGFKDELPPVYGSRPWLTQAFRELIANAARHATAKSQLEIILNCTGAHVVLTFRNHGQFAAQHLKNQFIYVPFNRVAQLVKEKKMPAKAVVGKRQGEEGNSRGPGIGLAICQQIMQLHGGHLRVLEGSQEDMVEFALELATGAPARDNAQLDIAQAQRYAKDMATLMNTMRQRKQSNSSNNAG